MRSLRVLALSPLLVAACATKGAGSSESIAPRTGDAAPVEVRSPHAGPVVVVKDVTGRPAPGATVWIVDRATLNPEAAVLASRTTGDWVMTMRSIATELRTSDANGEVRFGIAPPAGYLVAAELGAGFAGAERVGGSDEPIELMLARRDAYELQVTNAAGEAEANVVVSLAADLGGELRTLPSTVVTDARGRATLHEPPRAAFMAQRDMGELLAEYPRVAVARIPSRNRPRVGVAPGRSAVLVLPATAPLEIRAAHRATGDEHWNGFAQVFAASEGSRSTKTLAVPIEAGVARLPHVECGIDLRVVAVVAEASAPSRYVGSARGAIGALEDGVAFGHDLELDGGVFVTGRCVDEHGTPLGRRPLDLFVIGEPSTSWTVLTDADGAFRWLVPSVERGIETARIGARIGASGDETPRRGSVALAAEGRQVVRGGTVDVGDFVLTSSR